MVKLTEKYTDFNGNEREEEYRFHFTKAELVDMQTSTEGGLDSIIRNIIDTKDVNKLIQIFKELLIKSYGVVSPDGKRFQKVDDVTGAPLWRAFSETEAYSNIYMRLVSSDEEAAKFIEGIMPSDLIEEAKKIQASNN